MGVRAFHCLLFLMGISFCSATPVRVSYDGSSLYSLAELTQLLKQKDASHIRISDENNGLLRAVCNNSIDVDLHVSMKNVIAMSKSKAFAIAWVQREVLSLIHCMNISTISIYSELMTENQFPLLLHTLKAIHSALKTLKLDNSTKLSASFSSSFIEHCFIIPLKPSNKNFRKGLLQVMNFLQGSNSYLTINSFCGDRFSFRDCLISVINRAISVLPYDGLPLRINLRNSPYRGLIDRVEIGDKLMSAIGRSSHVSNRLLSLFIERPLVVEIEHKEFKHVEQSFQSFHQELTESKVQSTSNSPQLDVITPLATVPVVNPTTTPVVNPIISPATPTTPITTPTTTSPASSGQSWCIASQTASQTALQVALDYACGYGGTDCSEIQQGSSCYDPNTVHDHASYAFNDYYQKNPLPTSCNFGGAAVLTNIDPSSSTCQFPSTSTSSSVLNTTDPTGATVFGSQPSGPSNSASISSSMPILFTLSFHILQLTFLNNV